MMKVIISGGGTGGHIFPAIAIANAIKAKLPDSEILFVGAKGRMEMEKVPLAGYPIKALWISGLQRRLTIKNLSFPFKLISSLIKAGRIINEFKPDVVVGVGGYASGPLLYRAAKKRIPSLIQEQNSFPGITNRLLAKSVDKICVAYPDMKRFFPADKIIITGNPVRKEVVLNKDNREAGLKTFNLDKTKKALLVVGGSLGAKSINESIYNGLDKLIKKDIQLVWQTGKNYFHSIEHEVKGLREKGIYVFDFISEMDKAYAVADLVISRAGAISISELCITEKAAIVVPSPYVSEDHQTKNALSLINHNAIQMVKDVETKEKLVNNAIELIRDDNELKKLKENIVSLAYEDAAGIIADEIIGLVNKRQ